MADQTFRRSGPTLVPAGVAVPATRGADVVGGPCEVTVLITGR